MKFIAGIDGGGTKTKIVCFDLLGNEISNKVLGSFNINSIGVEQFEILLQSIIQYFDSLGTCVSVCIGAAGNSNKLMKKHIDKAMVRGGIKHWQVVGDHQIALYGALNGSAGMAIISGTGSICYGRNASGKEIRSGGWGHLIGDQGSAYAIGQQAIHAVSRQLDGYGSNTVITEKLALEMKLTTREKIISYVYKNDKTAIANLAPIVEQAGFENDKVAISIIQKNAQDLQDLALAVYHRLEFSKVKLATLGGLLEKDTLLRRIFLQLMEEKYPDIDCVFPENDASIGAVMMAQNLLEKGS